MKNKRLISLFLALSLAFSISLQAVAAPDVATRGDIVQMLISAADSYNPGVKKEMIIQGDENGNLNEGEPVKRIEALVMLGRAFGEMPAPRGDNLRMMNPTAQFSDLPEWAVAEMQNVLSSGIIAGTGDGKFSPNDNVTTEQMQLFIHRVWSLFGTNLKDDFYATINKSWLDASKLPAGQMQTGTMGEMTENLKEQVGEIIDDSVTAVKNAPATATNQQKKIANMFLSAQDTAGRKTTGLSPVTKYMTAIDSATSIKDLMEVRAQALKETGATLMLGFGLIPDAKDSDKYIVAIGMASPALTKEQYNGSDNSGEAYRIYVSKLLRMTGESESTSAHHALELYQFEKAISDASLAAQETGNIDKIYNVYSQSQIQALLPAIDVGATMKADGFASTDQILVMDEGAIKVNAQHFTDANLTLQQTIAKVQIMSGLGVLLIDDVSDAASEFSEEIYGVASDKTIAKQAASVTQSVLSTYIGQEYVEKNFSETAKNDVMQMVGSFADIFKQRIGKLDWMSAATKQQAVKKLDAMNYKIGYPEKWDKTLDDVQILAPAEGGTLFGNMCAISLARYASVAKMQNEPVDKSAWAMNVYDVNAYYNAQTNEMVFPAGILQAPFYSKNATREENLGGIGFVIAHEMTHAFDNNGAKFDAEGNNANWWTTSDYAAFEKKCAEVIEHYDAIEVAPGVVNNGTQSLSENIADLGSMACVLDAMKQSSAPNYKKLFESMASNWAMTSTKQFMQILANADVHSFNKLRINRVLVNFEEFYKTYNITEKDGMYVAPTDRVSIW